MEQHAGDGNVENSMLECGIDTIKGAASDDVAEGPMLDSELESPVNANKKTVDDGISNGGWNEAMECVFGNMGSEQVKAGYDSTGLHSVRECQMDIVRGDTTVVEESGVNGTVCKAKMHTIGADGGAHVAKPVGECAVANTQCFNSGDGLENSETGWAAEPRAECLPSNAGIEVASIVGARVSTVGKQPVRDGNVENGIMECGFNSIKGIASDDVPEGRMLDSDLESAVNANKGSIDDGIDDEWMYGAMEDVFANMARKQVKAGNCSTAPHIVAECNMEVVPDDKDVVEECGVDGSVSKAEMHSMDADGGACASDDHRTDGEVDMDPGAGAAVDEVESGERQILGFDTLGKAVVCIYFICISFVNM